MNKKQIILIAIIALAAFAVIALIVTAFSCMNDGDTVSDNTSSIASGTPPPHEISEGENSIEPSDISAEEPSDMSDDTSTEEPSDVSDDSSGEEPSDTSDDSSTEEPSDVSDDSPSEEPSDVSDDSPSEESKDPIPEIELPYNPKTLLSLRPADMRQSDLDRYFENSVFIGNSLMMDFYNYCTAKRREVPDFLGKAKFFCSYGYSAYIDLHDDTTVWPRYKGEALHSWEAVAKMDVDTVYYCLMGLTEIWKYPYNSSPEKTFESNRQVLEKIKEAKPGCKIVLLSCSYMVDSFNRSDRALNNYLISRFNAIALEWADQNGCDFVDVSTPFLVGDAIAVEYCRDPGEKGQGCHIKNDYYSAWAAVLRNYAYQKRLGAWQNPDEMRILKAHR